MWRFTNFALLFTALLAMAANSSRESIQRKYSGRDFWRSLAADGQDDLVCVRAQHKKQLMHAWMSDANTRQMAQVNPGNKARLRAAMQVRCPSKRMTDRRSSAIKTK